MLSFSHWLHDRQYYFITYRKDSIFAMVDVAVAVAKVALSLIGPHRQSCTDQSRAGRAMGRAMLLLLVVLTVDSTAAHSCCNTAALLQGRTSSSSYGRLQVTPPPLISFAS